MEKDEKTAWLSINKMTTRGKDNFGLLMQFSFNNLHWVLNYRGDAPLVIFRSNGHKHSLQVDGDVFLPVAVDLIDPSQIDEGEEESFDRYQLQMSELLRFINIMLYEDMELGYNDGEPEDADRGIDYDLFYEGKNQDAFKLFQQKVDKWGQILEEDIEQLQ